MARHSFCPRCGYTGKISGNICPKCGTNIGKCVSQPIFKRKIILAPLFAMIGIALIVAYFSISNKGVAAEFRHVRQPRPNVFYVGMDVSATPPPEVVDKFKENIISRLKQFVGDDAVSYQIDIFGNPGCGEKSFKTVVEKMQSPKDHATFTLIVDEKLREVKPLELEAAIKDNRYLTTPIHLLLHNIAKEKPGGRIIIFSDLINEDSDCPTQYPFPTDALIEFGKNPEGQMIFLYPSPATSSSKELTERAIGRQQEFIRQMEKLASEGKIRAFFYHIPDDLGRVDFFMKFQLQNSIPVTNFDIVVERVTKVVDTIVTAVRG
jgi:hypothetical protein